MMVLDRRTLLQVGGALLVNGCARPAPRSAGAVPLDPTPVARIEARVGGRVGVFAAAVGSNRTLAHRADERFAMCSTFKWVLAAAVLARVDRGVLALDQRVAYDAADLLDYAPVTRANAGSGGMTIEALAGAAVTTSDNTAANLLLERVGGPGGLTRFVRETGDAVTRLDRDEPSLNTNLPGDPRDTTSPRAMVETMQRILTGGVLTPPSRELLLGWLVATETGRGRLRSGLPADWRAGDKTGTGANGACNDVAIIWAPTGVVWLVAAYLSESTAPLPELNAAHGDVARVVVGA